VYNIIILAIQFKNPAASRAECKIYYKKCIAQQKNFTTNAGYNASKIVNSIIFFYVSKA